MHTVDIDNYPALTRIVWHFMGHGILPSSIQAQCMRNGSRSNQSAPGSRENLCMMMCYDAAGMPYTSSQCALACLGTLSLPVSDRVTSTGPAGRIILLSTCQPLYRAVNFLVCQLLYGEAKLACLLEGKG